MSAKAAGGRERIQRDFALHDFKATDDAGTFEGYVAVFSNLDGNGDIIDRGAFTKTLKEAMEVKSRDQSPYLLPLLWQHQEKEPIGGIMDAHEDEHGLFIRGQYDLDIDQGRRAYSGAKKGYVRGLSIGYDPIKYNWDQKRQRHLTEIRLWEGSPVTFPANTSAGILQVKAASGRTDWPLAGRDVKWDKSAAHARLLAWAGGADKLDVEKFKSVHFWYDPSAEDNVTAYKFPFCDVTNGKVEAIPHAIENGAARLAGANIGGDTKAVQAKMSVYYHKMAKQFDDPSIVAPWESKQYQPMTLREIKALGAIDTINQCARCLDWNADGSGDVLDALLQAAGIADDGNADGVDDLGPAVQSLMQTPGLVDAINAVQEAYAAWDQVTDNLLIVLGIPDNDNDDNDSDAYGPMYMSDSNSESREGKAGRTISKAMKERLMKVATGLQGHASELKSIAGIDENANDVDIDQEIAAGKKPSKDASEPGNRTTSSTSPGEPDAEAATLMEIEALVFMQSLEVLR